MTRWIDILLVVIAVTVSALYALYALGSKRIKNTYSRLATKYLGLRAARWFVHSGDGADCDHCSANPQAKKHH